MFSNPFKAATCALILLINLIFNRSESFAQAKSCGQNQDFEMVMMLDFTGSSNADEVAAEKAGVVALLDYFETASPKPRVALGKFNTVANIEVPLTANYILIRNALNQLPVKGSGGTRIKAALEEARVHFAENGNSSKVKFIMLFSDGLTTGVEDSKTIAKIIKSEGTYIFAVHYPAPNDPSRDIPGVELMRDFIASKPSSGFYHTVQDDLAAKVREISINIGCEDGLSCTKDICNLKTLLCESHELDSDGDGVKDCSDKCPNHNDHTLPPDTIYKDHDGDGILTCVDKCPHDPNKILPGLCGCGKEDIDTNGDGFADCLACTMTDFRSAFAGLKSGTKAQYKAINAYNKRIKKIVAKKTLDKTDKKLLKQVLKMAKKSNKLQKQALKLTSSLPSKVLTCRSRMCTTGNDFQLPLAKHKSITAELMSNSRFMYATMTRFSGNNKGAIKSYRKAATAYAKSYGILRQFPAGKPQCMFGS